MAENEVLIETSARHVHVTQETLEALFGKGAQLTKKKDLSQPGQFASEQRVTVVGPKKELANVSILGPCRSADQVELSATDARSIGLGIAIRESGDIAGTPGCTLRGPAGEVTIKEGVIVAKRHIHLTSETAEKLGAKAEELKQYFGVDFIAEEQKKEMASNIIFDTAIITEAAPEEKAEETEKEAE